MKHRHSGPLVRYRSKKGRILHRNRPAHNLTLKKQSGRRGSRRFLGFGKNKFKELEYVKAGIKPTASIGISQGDPDYDSKVEDIKDFASDNSLNLSVSEQSDGEEIHTIIVVSKDIPDIDWDTDDPEQIGEALGLPEKSIKAFADENRTDTLREVRDKVINEWDIPEKDYDLLEFVPYGLDKQEIEEEIEKRKEALR